MDIETRGRSRSKQANKTKDSNNLFSDSPDKSRSSGNKRAKSGGSSQNRRHAGVSSSYSPRSRSNKGTATQFAEARSLLVDQRSSGLSVDSKKKNRSHRDGKQTALLDPRK